MRGALKRAAQFVSPETIPVEISRLADLPLKDLKAAWAAEFGRAPPKGLWRGLLLRTLAWRLQEKVLGGHDKATLKLLEAYRQRRAVVQRYERLKTGTILIREFGGVRHTVTLVAGGFVWQDKTYPSLTAIARVITGSNWNGPRFFGLREGAGKKASQPTETARE